jgi:hypothetical protein
MSGTPSRFAICDLQFFSGKMSSAAQSGRLRARAMLSIIKLALLN